MKQSLGYAIQAFGFGVLSLDKDIRNRIAPVAVGAVKKFLDNQSMPVNERNDMLGMFRIVSGTVGIDPTGPLATHGQAMEIDEIIESSLPMNIPLLVLPPIRMVIEEYITGQTMQEIDFEKFDNNDARQLVHALMSGIELVNERCIQEPRKHPQNEIMCMGMLAKVVAQYAKEQLYR